MEETRTTFAQDMLAIVGDESADLIEFANSHAVDPELRSEAVWLQLEYQKSETEADKRAVRESMAALVRKIRKAHSKASPELLDEFAKRQEFLESQRGVDLDGKIVFRGTGIGFSYRAGGFRLEGIDLCLEQGKITGVVGQNANGKTTLFRIVVGEVRQTAGKLEYPLLDPRRGKGIDWPRVKEHIAYVPQELPPLYGTMEDNLRYTAAMHGQLGDENDLAVDHIVTRLHLREHMGSTWSQLSGGYKLRFALARALVSRPKLLALYEPLANLDFVSQLTVLRDIRDLSRSFRDPIAVLISSQHLHEIEAVADNILFIRRGRAVFNGSIEDIGTDTTEHVFELGTELSEEDLQQRIGGAAILSISHNGLSYVIKTDSGLGRDAFLGLLLKQKVSVGYFRDITHSVKLLFEDERSRDPAPLP
jgi:ABC-type multidrug transport system ATPase subunit